MNGPADTPETAAPDAGQGEDLTLEGILREAGCLAPAVRPLTAHEMAVQSFIGQVPQVSTSGRLSFTVDDPPARVVAWARELARCEVGPQPTWGRFVRHDLQRGAVFIVHAPRLYGDADLIAIAEKGVLTRGLLVDVSKWLFLALGLSRVTAHLPTHRLDLHDLARRAGFTHEGVTRAHYPDGFDASRWSMLARDCRWLAPRDRPRPAIPTFDAGPPASLKLH